SARLLSSFCDAFPQKFAHRSTMFHGLSPVLCYDTRARSRSPNTNTELYRMIRKVLMCTAAGVLAAAMACSKSSPNPTSPSTATQPEAGAAADGSTLKASTPAIVSPSGGGQVTDPVVLTATKAVGKF